MRLELVDVVLFVLAGAVAGEWISMFIAIAWKVVGA